MDFQMEMENAQEMILDFLSNNSEAKLVLDLQKNKACLFLPEEAYVFEKDTVLPMVLDGRLEQTGASGSLIDLVAS